jgi:TonB family protein
MEREVCMSPARFVAGLTFAFACLSGGTAAVATPTPQAQDALAPRAPLGIVHRVPVDVPAGLNPELGRVLVQLDASVAADGSVSDIRLISVGIIAQKVEMTADPDMLRKDFDAMVKAAIASVRQWRFDPPARAPASVRVPVRFDIPGGRTTFGSVRPLAGYPPHITAVSPSDVLRVGGAIQTPKKLVNVAPQYPADALEAKAQGVVILDVILDADGVPVEVEVTRSQPMLDAAAIEAVRQWRYEPTLLNGVPVPVALTVTLNFALDP